MHLSLAFSLLSGISGEDTENIIDRLQSMLASPLVRDAWDPAAWKCSVQLAVVVTVIPLRSGGFDQLLPSRADPLAAAADIGISDTTVASASATGADYVLGTTSDFALSRENTNPEPPAAHNRTQNIGAVMCCSR